MSGVCGDLGISVARARRYATYVQTWGHALDLALTAGRDPYLNHGTMLAYRYGR